MPEARYPTLDEFWVRLDERRLEEDLRAELRSRTSREEGPIERLPPTTATAVAGVLVPGAVPPQALAAFLDAHFDRQLGRGDEKAGLLPRPELIPAGFAVLDAAARAQHGAPFAELDTDLQRDLLARSERGELTGPEGFDAAVWFKRVRGLLLIGYGSDPRGMIEMGFPGPSYQPGHVWLDEGEVAARAGRRRGYRTL